MPGTVRAATIVTYVWAAITIGLTLVFALVTAVIGWQILGLWDLAHRDRIGVALLSAVVLSLVFSALLMVLAALVGRRHGWARIALAVCCLLAMTVGPWKLLIVGVPVFVFAGTVLVLLCLPSTSAWFRTT